MRIVDQWFWNLFVKACGSKCCCCGEPAATLERGHIIPYAAGGTDGLDNLLPLCRTCNKKYLKTVTPDNRPVDWCARFYLLLGQTLKPQISVFKENGLCTVIPTSYPVPNKELISWQNPILGQVLGVLPQSNTLTKQVAESLVRKLVIKSQECQPVPRLPYPERVTQMIVHAQKHGAEVFWNVGLTFLRMEPWMPNVPGHDIDRDSWRQLAEGFSPVREGVAR